MHYFQNASHLFQILLNSCVKKTTCDKMLFEFFEWSALKNCDTMAKIDLLEENFVPIYIGLKHKINKIIL
jgi:hypothetical protein